MIDFREDTFKFYSCNCALISKKILFRKFKVDGWKSTKRKFTRILPPHPTTHPHAHSNIYPPIIHFFIHLFIHPFIFSPINSLVNSSNYWSIHSLTHAFHLSRLHQSLPPGLRSTLSESKWILTKFNQTLFAPPSIFVHIKPTNKLSDQPTNQPSKQTNKKTNKLTNKQTNTHKYTYTLHTHKHTYKQAMENLKRAGKL